MSESKNPAASVKPKPQDQTEGRAGDGESAPASNLVEIFGKLSNCLPNTAPANQQNEAQVIAILKLCFT